MLKISTTENKRDMEEQPKSHFRGKTPVQHLAEAQAQGMLASSEIHGAETPGTTFASCDAAREAALTSLILGTELLMFGLPLCHMLTILAIFGASFAIWKVGRAAHLAWSRLERLHRVVYEEKREIEENREEERQELRVLYAAKGLQGKLLDDVVDVFMADGDRLLRVMLQEEMGFRLEENEHPLMQGLGAGLGAIFGMVIPVLGMYFCQGIGLFCGTVIVMIMTAYITASFQKNRTIPAMVWSIALMLFTYVSVLSCLKCFLGKEVI